MPIIKSAKKRMKQNIVRKARLLPHKTMMKTAYKKFLLICKDGDIEKAEKALKEAYSLIDTACKKNIICKNNAARKKSRMARTLNALGAVKSVKEANARS